MKKQVGLFVSFYLSMCVMLFGMSFSTSLAQAQKMVSISEQRSLLEDLLTQFLNTRDLCEEHVFSNDGLQECIQNQTQLRKTIEDKLKEVSWTSPKTLDWLLEWTRQKERVTANDLPNLTLFTNETNTLAFLKKMLPGSTICDPDTAFNLRDIVLKLLASWYRNQTPPSNTFLVEIRDFLYPKYIYYPLLAERGLMLHYASWFGDVRALDRSEWFIKNFLQKKGIRRFFQSFSVSAKDQFRAATLAVKDFTSSDKLLQQRASDLLQYVLDHPNTPETIKKSLR